MKPANNRLQIFGLFFGCPEITPLTTCPLEPYRNGLALEKLEVLKNLPEEEMGQILAHHKKCLLKRIRQNIKLYKT